jgi:hypothetical protein
MNNVYYFSYDGDGVSTSSTIMDVTCQKGNFSLHTLSLMGLDRRLAEPRANDKQSYKGV